MRSIIRKNLAWILLGVTLLGCKHGDDSSLASGDNGPAAPGTVKRAAEIHEQVVAALEADDKRVGVVSKDVVWFDSTAKLDTNWLVQSPENYWGKTAESLPKNLECKVSEANCDTTFTRRLCSTDKECASRNTTCQPLRASASKDGGRVWKMCLGSGDSLLDRYYDIMVSAEKTLDITTLGMSWGRFTPMLVNALAVLSQRANPPEVRIIISGKISRGFNYSNPAQALLDSIMADVNKVTGTSSKMKVSMRYLSTGMFSWNHSKIIIADQKRMLTGGHNMYDPDYLRDAPIFDLSLETQGQIVPDTQKFINKLWHVASTDKTFYGYNAETVHGNYPDREYEVPSPVVSTEPVEQAGTVPVIGMGRLANYSKNFGAGENQNPSDAGIRALVSSSTKTLDFAVQDLYFKISAEFTGWSIIDKIANYALGTIKPPWMLNEIVNAVAENKVKLRVVQSNQNEGVEGYTMNRPEVAYEHLRKSLFEKIKKTAKAKGFKNDQEINQFICDHVEYTGWHFKEGEESWADKTESQGKIGSHPKLLIVDDAAFYLGSHNFYDSNLQEYGLIVTDPATTKDLQKQYWDKVWLASAPSKVKDANCK